MKQEMEQFEMYKCQETRKIRYVVPLAVCGTASCAWPLAVRGRWLCVVPLTVRGRWLCVVPLAVCGTAGCAWYHWLCVAASCAWPLAVRGIIGCVWNGWCYCRKERRVFEEYVQQCRAGQERKDREEIEALRDEV